MQQNIDPGAQASIDAGYGARSPEWPRVAGEHLLLEPTCRVCGSMDGRNVHHIMPFHICRALGRPELELDQRNLITLCEGAAISHHLLIGHLDDWQSYNPDVTTDVTGPFRQWTDNQQIRADPQWSQKAQNRPLALRDWNEQQIADFKLRMDTLYPRQEGAVVSAQVQVTTASGVTTTTTVEAQAPASDGTTTTTTTTTVSDPTAPDSTSGTARAGG